MDIDTLARRLTAAEARLGDLESRYAALSTRADPQVALLQTEIQNLERAKASELEQMQARAVSAEQENSNLGRQLAEVRYQLESKVAEMANTMPDGSRKPGTEPQPEPQPQPPAFEPPPPGGFDQLPPAQPPAPPPPPRAPVPAPDQAKGTFTSDVTGQEGLRLHPDQRPPLPPPPAPERATEAGQFRPPVGEDPGPGPQAAVSETGAAKPT